jgi:hypothetical protein
MPSARGRLKNPGRYPAPPVVCCIAPSCDHSPKGSGYGISTVRPCRRPGFSHRPRHESVWHRQTPPGGSQQNRRGGRDAGHQRYPPTPMFVAALRKPWGRPSRAIGTASSWLRRGVTHWRRSQRARGFAVPPAAGVRGQPASSGNRPHRPLLCTSVGPDHPHRGDLAGLG